MREVSSLVVYGRTLGVRNHIFQVMPVNAVNKGASRDHQRQWRMHGGTYLKSFRSKTSFFNHRNHKNHKKFN